MLKKKPIILSLVQKIEKEMNAPEKCLIKGIETQIKCRNELEEIKKSAQIIFIPN